MHRPKRPKAQAVIYTTCTTVGQRPSRKTSHAGLNSTHFLVGPQSARAGLGRYNDSLPSLHPPIALHQRLRSMDHRSCKRKFLPRCARPATPQQPPGVKTQSSTYVRFMPEKSSDEPLGSQNSRLLLESGARGCQAVRQAPRHPLTTHSDNSRPPPVPPHIR